MFQPSCLWLWFPSKNRWVAIPPEGAMIGFVHYGQDVAWGRQYPHRPGIDPVDWDKGKRFDRWLRFLKLVNEHPLLRHRIATV